MSVPEKESLAAEPAADLLGVQVADGEGHGGRARVVVGRAVDGHTGDQPQTVDQVTGEGLLVGLARHHAGDDLAAAAGETLEARGERRVGADPPQVVPAHVGDELDGRGGAGDALVVERAGLELEGRLAKLGAEAQGAHDLGGLAPRVEHADVRREELVGRAEQEVAVEGGDVDDAVQRVVHGVDHGQGSGRSRHLDDAPDVVDGAHRVARPDGGHDPGALVQQALEDVPGERAGRGVDGHLAHDHAAILQREPGAAVGLVVELGDEDLVALLHVVHQAVSQQEVERRGVGSEGHLVPIATEEVGEGVAGVGQHVVGLDGGREVPVGVRVVVDEIVGHGVDDALRYLGAARGCRSRRRVGPRSCAPGRGTAAGRRGHRTSSRCGSLGGCRLGHLVGSLGSRPDGAAAPWSARRCRP